MIVDFFKNILKPKTNNVVVGEPIKPFSVNKYDYQHSIIINTLNDVNIIVSTMFDNNVEPETVSLLVNSIHRKIEYYNNKTKKSTDNVITNKFDIKVFKLKTELFILREIKKDVFFYKEKAGKSNIVYNNVLKFLKDTINITQDELDLLIGDEK